MAEMTDREKWEQAEHDLAEVAAELKQTRAALEYMLKHTVADIYCPPGIGDACPDDFREGMSREEADNICLECWRSHALAAQEASDGRDD